MTAECEADEGMAAPFPESDSAEPFEEVFPDWRSLAWATPDPVGCPDPVAIPG